MAFSSRALAFLVLCGCSLLELTQSFQSISVHRFAAARGNLHNHNSNAFQHHQQQHGRPASASSSSPTSLSMCICINCARVTNCAAYHFVESKHNQPHMTEDPTFTPRDGTPTIHVNIRSTSDQIMGRIYQEHQEETAQAEAEAAAAAAKLDNSIDDNNNDENNDSEAQPQQPLTGKTVYDLSSSTTVEYDVVACDDFVEDQGCWVRNMPEEIRLANPDFVPT